MKYQEINVFFDAGDQKKEFVGVLASTGSKVFFEYEPTWVSKGIELSPIHLPLSKKNFQLDAPALLNSLPGLFSDSLPDGWGMLIMDHFFLKKGIARHQITPIDRLAYLGDFAMGALCYNPALDDTDKPPVEAVNIGESAREANRLFEGKIEDAGRLLAKIGGSPGGARPKALIGISENGTDFVSGIGPLPESHSHWMIKFSGPKPNELREFGKYEGVLEYLYLQIAQSAGLNVPEYRLITDDKGIRHIAVRRFDRPTYNVRLHSATACGMLHADCRLPSLDYYDLLKFAWVLTKDASQVLEQFRRAVFNLFASNRDDHSKNHGYLLDSKGRWNLSPAYDITFTHGPGGQHWTSYEGEGETPKVSALKRLAEKASINTKDALDAIEQTKSSISEFPKLAKSHHVPPKIVNMITDRLNQILISAGS